MEKGDVAMTYIFNPQGDFKKQFEKETDKLIQKGIEERKPRMKAVEELIDSYITQVPRNYERPDGTQLERLTDLILNEELTDRRKNKARVEEYPIFTEYQLERRRSFEVPTSRLTNEKGETYVSTKGNDQRIPTRRKLTNKELLKMDYDSYRNQVIARANGLEDDFIRQVNTERQRKERESRKPGPVVSYNLKDLPANHLLRKKYLKE